MYTNTPSALGSLSKTPSSSLALRAVLMLFALAWSGSALGQTRTYTFDNAGNRTAATGQVRFTTEAAFQVAPRRALVGDPVSLFGRNFPTAQPTQLQVLFGATPATILGVSSRVITVEVPSGVTSGRVKIILPGGAELLVGEVFVQGVDVTPGLSTVNYGQTQAFSALVTGAANTSVTWSVNGIAGGSAGVGTIDAAGLYTAPDGSPALEGPFYIRAHNVETGLDGVAIVEIGCTASHIVSYGAAHSDAIANSSQRICHSITGAAGDMFWITTAGASLRWTLRAPDGTLLDNWTGPSRRVDFELPIAGTYELAVRTNNGFMGSYILGISDQPTESLALIPYDTQVADSLSPVGDVDEWPVNGSAGDVVTIYADTTTSSDVRFRLLDATTRAVLVTGSSTTWSDADDSELLDYVLPTTGSYIVQVYTEAVITGEPTYTLAIQKPGTDVQPLAYGQSIVGTIAFPADTVAVEFTATAGDLVWLTNFSSQWFRYRLEAPDGTTVFSQESTSFRKPEHVLNESGAYRLHVRSRASTTGTFAFGLSDQPIEVLAPLAYGTQIAEALTPLGDVDEWPLAGVAGEVITVYADTSTSADVRVRLMNALTRAVIITGSTSTWSDADDSEILDFELPTTGDYILQVYNESTSTGTPTYTLTVNHPGLDVVAIGWGQAHADTIDFAADAMCIEWPAVAGDIAWMTISNSYWLRFRLEAPDGSIVDEREAPSWRMPEMTFAQTGTYRMFIRSYAASTSSFTLALSDQPTETLPALTYNNFVADALSPAGDVDDHPFSGNAGEEITLYADTTTSADIRVRILDPVTRAVLTTGSSSTWSDADDSEILDFALPATGNYLAQVYNEATSTAVPTYTLALNRQGEDTVTIGYGQAHAGTIDFAGDASCVEWPAQAGDLAWLLLYSPGWLRFRLEAPDGSIVDERESPTYRMPEMTFAQTGTYKLFIRSYAASTGSFTIGLSDQPTETLAALPYDALIAGDLSPAGDVDDYPFAGTAGEKLTVYVDSLSSTDVRVRLLDPVTRAVLVTGSATTWSDADDSEILDYELPQTGSYIAQVYTEQSTLGLPSYTIALNRPGEEAFTIGYGQAHSDSIDFAGDAFTVEWPATAGDIAWITYYCPSWMRFRLEAPDGSIVDERESTSFRLSEHTFTQTGTYRIYARSYASTTSVVVLGLSDQPTETLGGLADDTLVADALSPAGDVDDWTISGVAGELITVNVDTTTSTDMRVRLLDAVTRAVVTTGSTTTWSDSDDSEIIDFALPATGDYIVQTYTELITNVEPAYTVAVNRPGAEVYSIAWGQEHADSIDFAGDAVCVEWSANAGDIAWVTAYCPSWLRFRLEAPDGSTVDERESTSFRLSELTFAQTGTYKMYVRSYASSTSVFSIGLSDQPSESLTALSYDSLVADTLGHTGDVDDFPISGNAGDKLSVYVETTTSTDMRVRLLDAVTRAVLITGTTTTWSDSDDSEILDFELPSTGNFIAQVYTELVTNIAPAYTIAANRIGAETHSISYGQSYDGALAFSGDAFTVEWNSTAGDIAWVSAGTPTWLRFRLEAPDGTTVDERESVQFRLAELTFAQTGTYRMYVRSRASSFGAISIGVSDQETETLPTLVLNTPQADALSPYGDVDEWPFSGTASQVVTFYGDTTTSTDIQIRLLDASTRAVLATGSTTTGSDSDDSEIAGFSLPATGSYLVQVYTEQTSLPGTAAYTVSAQ